MQLGGRPFELLGHLVDQIGIGNPHRNFHAVQVPVLYGVRIEQQGPAGGKVVLVEENRRPIECRQDVDGTHRTEERFVGDPNLKVGMISLDVGMIFTLAVYPQAADSAHPGEQGGGGIDSGSLVTSDDP